MKFSGIPSGTSVFVDANVFIYDFAPDPLFGIPCRELLERIELGDLKGFCTSRELSDVAHRLMTLEACQSFGWPFAGIGQRLRTSPKEISQLVRFRQALDEIIAMKVQVLPVAQQDVSTAC
jgi:predicted nucleic acid-binding protein